MNRYVEFQLDGSRKSFEKSGNPYFVWEAILLCIAAGNPRPTFPGWIVAYLLQCSKRMRSEKAEQTSDLREILPWVFGFPKKKRGTGKLLRPRNLNPKKGKFLVEFALRILEGEDPVAARSNACNAFDGKDADISDQTLMRWILDAFRLENAPEDPKQWKEIAYQFSAIISATRRLSRMDVAPAEVDEVMNELAQLELNRRTRPGGQLIDRRRLAVAIDELKLVQTKFRETLT